MRTAFFLVTILASSCMTPKKWAEGCAERFPVKESTVFVKGEIRVDTAYLAPDTLVFTDTLMVDCDTVKGVITKYVNQVRPCPPAQIRTITQVDTVVITEESTAAADAHKRRADTAEAKVERLAEGRNTWRWISIVCFLMIGAAIFSKIKGFV